MRHLFLLLLPISLLACSPQPSALEVEREILFVYVDAFSERWLPDLYTCADRSSEWLVSRTSDIDSANIILELISPTGADSTTYQVGEFELVIALNAQNPLADLSLADVRAIYTGKVNSWEQLGWNDIPVQVWGYSRESRLNEILLEGENISSLAKQAQSPEAMRSAIVEDIYAIGFLPREDTLLEGRIRIVELEQKNIYPVLVTLPEDNDKIIPIVQCLQETLD